MTKYKFSGFCYITIEDHKIIENDDIYDYNFVGQTNWLNENIDFEYDILDEIKEDDKINNLEDGDYYIYFNGTTEFSSEYNYDCGCYEDDVFTELDEIYYQKLDEDNYES